jgi:hypothetical protein
MGQGNGMPGVCLKMSTDTGNAGEDPLSHPLNDHHENIFYAPVDTELR